MSGYSHNEIVQHEAAAASAMGVAGSVRIPIPDVKTAEKLTEMGVVLGSKIDHVLQNAALPANWHIRQIGDDARHRFLHDEKGVAVAKIFLKNSGYNYYGNISLCS